jgi:ATP-binding protein involved in chromosome partitioning
MGDAGSNVSAQIGAQQARLHARMATVRAKLAIVSGKGGVGKSAIAANLSAAFAARGLRVGALDADLNGPCLAKMLGVREAGLAFEPGGVRPVRGPLGVRVVSMDLLLPSDDAPVVWRGPGEEGGHLWRGAAEVAALREFLADTEWGALDLLVLDLPPGTDRIPSLLALLPDLDGVVLVTLPSQVSHLIVAKSVTMVRDVVKAPILGLVENMGARSATSRTRCSRRTVPRRWPIASASRSWAASPSIRPLPAARIGECRSCWIRLSQRQAQR